MENVLQKILRVVRWVFIILGVVFIALVIYRIPAVEEKEQTALAIKRIYAQKITLDDVMGNNLPPVPDSGANDATIAGIDSNRNGVRDDVELAIFKAYPDSAKIRAAELQYALTQQMFLTQVFNVETWKAVAEKNGRAHLCIIDTKGNRKEVEGLVFNTAERVDAREKIYDFITSYGPEPGEPCDISLN